MDITVYLPDELGAWAKENGVNLSQTLRAQLESEWARRKAIADTLVDTEIIELDVEDRHGRTYTARLHGTPLHDRVGDVAAYLGEDEQIWVHDEGDHSLNPIAAKLDVDKMLSVLLSEDEYIEAMSALGLFDASLDEPDLTSWAEHPASGDPAIRRRGRGYGQGAALSRARLRRTHRHACPSRLP